MHPFVVKHIRVYQENIPYPIPNETIPNQLRYCVNVDQFDVRGLSSWTQSPSKIIREVSQLACNRVVQNVACVSCSRVV